jgi:hypothetical protein
MLSAIAGVPGFHAPQAAVFELNCDPTTVIVNAVGESREPGDERGIVYSGHARRCTPTFPTNDRSSLTEESRSGSGCGFQVGDQSVNCVVAVAGTFE